VEPGAGPRHPVRIAPSLIAADLSDLRAACRLAERCGADMLHLDVMDGRFVPNLTFGPLVVEAVRRCTELYLDVHLMVVEPDGMLEAFRRAGADGITVHAEAALHLQRTLATIARLGARPGVALNPATPESAVEYVWDACELVLCMTVNPGWSGQVYLPAVATKVRRLRAAAERAGWHGHLEVDGGIAPETAAEVVAAGADTLVAGSAVFGRPDPAAALRSIREAARTWASAAGAGDGPP
jgi:ribulose-phosphate 3-epimerase